MRSADKGGRFLRFCAAAVLAAGAALPAWAAPVRYVLGQYPLPEGDTEERFQTGFLRIGHYLKNDQAAASARPDGTGTSYNIYQLFLRDTAKEARLGFVADGFFLSDRERNNFNFTQLNYLLGISMRSDSLRLQFDREEIIPIDRGGRSFRYWDVRAVLEFATGEDGKSNPPAWGGGRKKSLPGRLAASLMAGYFLHNNSFPARADLGGLAALRYVARGEASYGKFPLRIAVEADFVTEEQRALFPVNMDLSVGIGARLQRFDLMFWRKTSDVLDRPGYHRYYLITLTYPFDSRDGK